MDKVTCNVINDMLPLYADEVVSADTKALIEEHLAGCEDCAEKYRDMKWEIELNIGLKAVEAEKQAILAAKKKIRKKRIVTAAAACIIGVIVIVAAVYILNNIRIPIKYEEEKFRVGVEREYDENWMYLYYDGLISGHNLIGMLDAVEKEEVMYIEMYTTPWDELFGSKEKNDKQRICIDTLDDEYSVMTELRLVVGDIRMMYSPSRDYDKMMEDSVLLWERDDGLRYGMEAGKGVKRTQ